VNKSLFLSAPFSSKGRFFTCVVCLLPMSALLVSTFRAQGGRRPPEGAGADSEARSGASASPRVRTLVMSRDRPVRVVVNTQEKV